MEISLCIWYAYYGIILTVLPKRGLNALHTQLESSGLSWVHIVLTRSLHEFPAHGSSKLLENLLHKPQLKEIINEWNDYINYINFELAWTVKATSCDFKSTVMNFVENWVKLGHAEGGAMWIHGSLSELGKSMQITQGSKSLRKDWNTMKYKQPNISQQDRVCAFNVLSSILLPPAGFSLSCFMSFAKFCKMSSMGF